MISLIQALRIEDKEVVGRREDRNGKRSDEPVSSGERKRKSQRHGTHKAKQEQHRCREAR